MSAATTGSTAAAGAGVVIERQLSYRVAAVSGCLSDDVVVLC